MSVYRRNSHHLAAHNFFTTGSKLTCSVNTAVHNLPLWILELFFWISYARCFFKVFYRCVFVLYLTVVYSAGSAGYLSALYRIIYFVTHCIVEYGY